MRVAFFVGSFPEISETFILRQVTGLIDLGHEVDIYSVGRPKENGRVHHDVTKYRLLERTTYMVDLIPEASGYWEMPVWPVSGETWIPGRETAILNSERVVEAAPRLIECLVSHPKLAFEVLDRNEYGEEADSLSALYRLSTLSRLNKKYDVLHAHFGPNGNCFRFTRELWKAPFIVTFHGYDMGNIPQTNFYPRLFETVDIVTAHSSYAKHRIEQLGCAESKIKYLNVGVNINEFQFKERVLAPGETVRILSVARLVERKGIAFSIKAIAELIKSFPNVRYDVIGEGHERANLETLICGLGVQDQVILHGAQNGDYVRSMMNEAHIFVLPSIKIDQDQEGTPVSLMEAQACGLPVIATDTGGTKEVILDGRSGYLVPERDSPSLSHRIASLITDSACWTKMGQTGREHIEKNYDIKALNDQLVYIYQQAILNYSHN